MNFQLQTPDLKHRIRSYLRTIGQVFVLQFKQLAIDGFIIFTVLVQPLLIAIMGLWMLRGQRGNYAVFIVIGSGMTGLWSSLLYISGSSINVERWLGTLEMLVGTPTPLAVTVIGKTLSNVVMSLSSMVLGYVLAALIFRFPLTLARPLLFVISLFFTVIAFSAFGLLIGPFFAINLQMQRWVNALEFPMYILAGFMFPIALLPGWTTPISYALAPYWAALALHATSSGGIPLSQVFLSWGMMLLFSAIYLIASGWLFRVMVHRARVDATLSLQ
ncbi:MAG: ABC transporter permease [Chloroflexi bacterium]|nr:ABC transporter permease [Chloroflexota bacterium]